MKTWQNKFRLTLQLKEHTHSFRICKNLGFVNSSRFFFGFKVFCAYSVPVAHDNLINFEGSRFRDPLPSIGEVVSEKHMGVCTEERPVMHWVSKPFSKTRSKRDAHATAMSKLRRFAASLFSLSLSFASFHQKQPSKFLDYHRNKTKKKWFSRMKKN